MSIEEYLPFGMGMEELIASAAATMVSAGAIAIYKSFLDKVPIQRRNKAISERKALLRQQLIAPKRRPKVATITLAREIVNRAKLMTGKPLEEATNKLVRAGFRSRDAITVFLFAKLCLPAVLGAAVLIGVYGLDMYNLTAQGKLFTSVGTVLFGFFLPDIYVKNIANKRMKELVRAMPDMLDLLVICAEAGLSLDNAIVRVAQEIRFNSKEMADELELTSAELGFMAERKTALENLHKRTNMQAMQALVSTLAQSERYGTPLAQSLRVLASELRDERLMRAEEKAAQLPATMTVPMIIFIMPALFIVLIGPGCMRAIDVLIPAIKSAGRGG